MLPRDLETRIKLAIISMVMPLIYLNVDYWSGFILRKTNCVNTIFYFLRCSLQESDKYKNAVKVYLDKQWHRARKTRLQNFVQQVKKKYLHEQAQETKRKIAEYRNSSKK